MEVHYFSKGSKGKITPVAFTPKDFDRIKEISRWYMVAPDYLARVETDPKHWSIANRSGLPPLTQDDGEKMRKQTHNVLRRLRLLKNIQPVPSLDIGAPVDSFRLNSQLPSSNGHTSGWIATRYGSDIVNAPWLRYISTVNPLIAGHAFMAADIGLCIEKFGKRRVYSEREHSSGWAADFTKIREYKVPKLTGSSEGYYKPDIVIPAPDGQHFIAVEVERKVRKPEEYRTKIRSYIYNRSVVAVWYICESESVVQKIVDSGKGKAYGKNAAKLRVIRARKSATGHYEIPLQIEQLQADLAELDSWTPERVKQERAQQEKAQQERWARQAMGSPHRQPTQN